MVTITTTTGGRFSLVKTLENGDIYATLFSRSHCYCQMVHKVAPWLLQIAVVGIPTKNRASMRERCISKTTTTGYAVRDSVGSVFPTRITFHAPEAPERSRSVGWWLASHAFYRTVVPLPPDRLT